MEERSLNWGLRNNLHSQTWKYPERLPSSPISTWGDYVLNYVQLFATPWTTRLFCPWDFPGKNTGMGCRFLLWGIFLIQGSNLHLLHWQADSLPTPEFLGFPCCSAGKESAWNAGDVASIPGLGRSLGEGKGYPLKYTGLERSKDCVVHGVAKSRTRLSNFTSLLTTEPPGKPHI